jgi:hypothetical protein
MRALFAHGMARGRDPASWRTSPPPVGMINVPAAAEAQGAARP